MRVIDASEPPPRADLIVSVGLGCWLVFGLFIDGWAHRIPGLVDSFFTPWHAILYAGYLANAGWVASNLWRTTHSLRLRDIRIPAGGVLGVWGLLIFGIGGFFDVLWHTAVGIERGLEVFFTPSHLMLFIGASLTLTTPFCAMWAARRDETTPSLSAFLPAVVSLGLTMSVVSFFVSYSWGFFGFSLIGVGEEQRWSVH